MTEEATAINKKNENTSWQDAMTKEMEKVKVVFHILCNATNMLTSTWRLTLKWSISVERHT